MIKYITIGEIFKIYRKLILLICIIFANYFINKYMINILSELNENPVYLANNKCENFLTLMNNKINNSKSIIQLSLIITVILFTLHNKIIKLYKCNETIYEYFLIFIYILSSIFNNYFSYYGDDYNEYKNICGEEYINMTYIIIYIYTISDILVSIILTVIGINILLFCIISICVIINYIGTIIFNVLSDISKYTIKYEDNCTDKNNDKNV